MIFVVLYKHYNCAADKNFDAGHAGINDCNWLNDWPIKRYIYVPVPLE